jgi:hypothetical protein
MIVTLGPGIRPPREKEGAKMSERWRALLVAHGALVFLLGLAAGIPYGLVLIGWAFPGDDRGWRMAHLEGVLNGILLIAVAAAGGQLRLSERAQRWLAWGLVATAWGNAVASVLAPLFEVRGLQAGGSFANTLVWLLFMLAVVAVVVAMVLVARGALAARQ